MSRDFSISVLNSFVMTPGVILIFILCLPNIDSLAQSAKVSEQQSSEFEPQSLRSMRLNLKAFIKNSRSADRQIQTAAIANLCQLHIVAAVDPRLHTNNIIKGIRSTTASRLNAMATQLRAAVPRDSLSAGQAERVTRNSIPSKASFDSGFTANRRLPNDDDSQPDYQLLGYRIANNLHGSFVGGAGQLANYVGGPFGGSANSNAMELIALIEATLNPASWRSNGGTASMRYYEPGLALVVTATHEMHDRIEALLWQLK